MTDETEDLYAVLGVHREATPAQIKAAYRKIVRDLHPDAGGDPDEFVRITAAYNVLEDEDTRKAYDLSGEYGEENPLELQKRVITHIVTMFEEIYIQADGQIAFFDVIASMKSHVAGLKGQFLEIERVLAKKLEGLHKIDREIKKRGEGVNMFADHIENRISELSEEYKRVRMQIRDVRRVAEELNRSDSLVAIIRTVQSGAYPGQGNDGWYKFVKPNLTLT